MNAAKMRLVAVFVILAMAVILVGATQAAEKSLEVWLTMGADQLDIIRSGLDSFEKAHDVKVNVSQITWGEYNEKVLSSFAAGTAPDVLMTGAAFVWQVANEGLGIPLDKRAEAWGQLDDFAPGALRGTSFNGHLYGIPLMTPTRSMWYRKDLFEEVGLSADNPPVMWRDIRSASRKLVRQEGDKVTRIGFSVPSDILFHAFLTNDVKWMAEDLSKATFNTPEGLEAAEFWSEFAIEMSYPGLERQVKPLEQGGIGMVYGYPPSYSRIVDTDPDLLDEIGGPVVMKNRSQAAYTYPDWVYVTSQSKDPDLAWDFITWLVEPMRLAEIDKETPHPPSRRSSFDHPFYSSETGELARRMFLEATVPYGTEFEKWPNYLAFWGKYKEIWNKTIDGSMAPKNALIQMEAELNKLLDETMAKQKNR